MYTGPFRIEAMVHGWQGGFLVEDIADHKRAAYRFRHWCGHPDLLKGQLPDEELAPDFYSLRLLDHTGRTVKEEVFSLPSDEEIVFEYEGEPRATEDFEEPASPPYQRAAAEKELPPWLADEEVDDVLCYNFGLLSAIENPNRRQLEMMRTVEEMWLKHRLALRQQEDKHISKAVKAAEAFFKKGGRVSA